MVGNQSVWTMWRSFETRCDVVWRDDFDGTGFNLRQVQPASCFASQAKEHNGKVAIFDINSPNKSDEADFSFPGEL
jgi:hypothetical protein